MYFNFLFTFWPASSKSKKNASAFFFHFLAGRQFFFTQIPIWSEAGNFFSLWPGRPGWAVGGRRLPRTAESWLRPGLAGPQPLGPSQEDEDYLGRQNPGRGQASLGLRSLVLRFPREAKVKKTIEIGISHFWASRSRPDSFFVKIYVAGKLWYDFGAN